MSRFEIFYKRNVLKKELSKTNGMTFIHNDSYSHDFKQRGKNSVRGKNEKLSCAQAVYSLENKLSQNEHEESKSGKKYLANRSIWTFFSSGWSINSLPMSHEVSSQKTGKKERPWLFVSGSWNLSYRLMRSFALAPLPALVVSMSRDRG